MTTCPDYQREFAAYKSGELAPETALALAHHLENCPECRREMAATESLATHLPTALAVKAPAGLLPNILAECRGSKAHNRNLKPFLRSAAMGLAAMLAVLVFRTAPLTPSSGSSTPPLTPPARTFTASELGTARRDLAWTLTTTGRVLDRTSLRVIGDIFNRMIPRAISTSLHQALTTNPKGRS